MHCVGIVTSTLSLPTDSCLEVVLDHVTGHMQVDVENQGRNHCHGKDYSVVDN
jgi:hypothetical protein